MRWLPIVVTIAAVAASAAVAADAPAPVAIPGPPFRPEVTSFVRPSPPQLEVVSDVGHPVVTTTRSAVVSGGPAEIAGEGVLDAFRQGPLWFVTYGRDGASARYLLSFREGRPGIRYVLDLNALARTTAATPSDSELVYAQVRWAREADGVLYVQNAHLTYASSSRMRNGAITAIDLRTKRVLWRSPSLVANAGTFVLAPGNRIVTGYGFTAEPDFVYVLDRGSGAVLDRLPVRDAPERITRRGDEVRVETYSRSLVLRLRS
ncbi:MAG: hypothetical protein FJW96_06785 [Actinobacteria bacterium]|nr:hypothetical protein [Actinomycetota bacterium]